MSRLLRLFSYSAPLLSMVAGANDEFIEIRVPMKPQAGVPLDGLQLLQNQVNITDSIRVVQVPTNLFSANCGELLVSLNQESGGGQVQVAAQLMASYIQLVVSVFQQCVIPDLLTPNEINNNQGDLVVINASPCIEVQNQLAAFSSLCQSAIPNQPPQICDMTFQQNFFFDQPGNSIEAYIGYDVYWCTPNSCSADDVERLGAAVMSGLSADTSNTDITGTSQFGVWSTCSDSAGFIRDFNGGAPSFITGLTLSGQGDISPNIAAGSIVISVESPISPTPLVDGVVCKITDGLPAEDFAKNCCGQLNLDPDFQSLRMYCDVSERSGSSFNMSIYSPFDNLAILCQADQNAQDNQPGNQPQQPCTTFSGVNTVGISLSGSTFEFNPEQMPTQILPTTRPIDIPTLPNQQTLPPQVITGNGPAPPLIEILNVPNNAATGSTRPMLVASLLSAALAFFSSRV